MTSGEKEKKGRLLVMAVAVTGGLALLAACAALMWGSWNVYQEKIEPHPERAPRYAFGSFDDEKGTRLVEATLPLIDCARSDAVFPGEWVSFHGESKAGDCVPEHTWSDALETVRGAGCTVRDVRRYPDGDFMTQRVVLQFVCQEVSA